ncbi:MAG: serine hydrolase, partial [Opitutaceae bacterium]
MVRAVALHLGASGSYYLASQGAFSRDDFAIPALSSPALPAVIARGKISGTATEVGSDIRHPNGNIFDQVLLQGDFATVAADPGQVLRLSYLDLNDDIVQVEFSGAGELSIALESMSGPANPAKYNQAIAYMKGHATIVITGADETTNVSVFSVGRATAVNQALFRNDVTYDGVADLASLSIFSATGKFGGVRTANARFSHNKSVIGVFAPDVQFTGPVYIGEVTASEAATPILGFGTSVDVQITGGNLLQPNDRPVQINGITVLTMSPGTNSHGTPLAAQSIRGRLERNGIDVTTQVVVGP